MAECAQCGDDFAEVFVCSVCGDAHCLSHRRRSGHDCVETTKPRVRSLEPENWSRLSFVVVRLLFVLFLVTLVLMLVNLLT